MEKAIKASTIISDKDAALKSYLTAADGKSNAQARGISKEILGVDITGIGIVRYLLPSLLINHLTLPLLVPRTREGYYHYTGGEAVRSF